VYFSLGGFKEDPDPLPHITRDIYTYICTVLYYGGGLGQRPARLNKENNRKNLSKKDTFI
jgi:hypothetical protein